MISIVTWPETALVVGVAFAAALVIRRSSRKF
jgi:hypothetical protein